MRLLYIPITAFILILSYNVCYGEFPVSTDLNLYGTYTDNIYQTSLPESDYISLTQLDLSYDFGSRTSIFYDASLSLFSKHSELYNHDHYLGIGKEKDVFQDKGILFFGSKLGLRRNTDEFNLYNRYSGTIYTDLKYAFSETLTGKAGYNIDYESYPDYQSFSFLENSTFLHLSKSFQTKTSLHLGIDTGWRSYPNLEDQNGASNSIQIKASAKIAQSLADNTGAQLQYSWHYVPKSVKYDEMLEEGYFFIEDILENEYSFSSHEYQITLKHLGPWGIILKGMLIRENRNYNISISTDEQNRRDTNISIYLELEKIFSLIPNSFNDLSLHLEFLHKKSNSNDNYFDYSTNIISIGTKAAF